MAKPKSIFVCSNCGAHAPKWTGQCVECDRWNTLIESVMQNSATGVGLLAPKQSVVSLGSVEVAQNSRFPSGISELDRVLGGGLVEGSVVLLGGDPGIGKSTLLLQSLAFLCKRESTLYVTGEESAQQIALRAQRLEIDATELRLLADNTLETVLATAQNESPRILVLDSIQTIYTEQLGSAPGSVAQVRETAAQLVRFAKRSHAVVILIGHVTKEGAIAGPRILEHMVDTVLYFEGDTNSRFRLVRAIKNRFGAINEIGVFVMTERGLREVSNPSAMFINREGELSPGRITLVTQEGSRPLLVEVQALVDKSSLANPRRLTVGLEQSRLAMLLAVLHRHGGISVYDQDVFVNAVGGMKVSEPAADLAVTLSVISSLRNVSIAQDIIVFGEIGLTGEVRPVQNGIDRLREAAKLGYSRAVIPHGNQSRQIPQGIEVTPVRKLAQAMDFVFP